MRGQVLSVPDIGDEHCLYEMFIRETSRYVSKPEMAFVTQANNKFGSVV